MTTRNKPNDVDFAAVVELVEAIRAKVHVDSDADPSTIAEPHHKVVSTSPVGHTITRPVAVSVDLA